MNKTIIGDATLYLGDCMVTLKSMPDNSVDSIVTDPPYGLSFMNKTWDYDVPGVEVWAECLRVLKPGGHLLAFAGTRTQHRMAVRIEDAGFEIRDMIAWVYGSGFPKSLDVSKAIDKAEGVEREVVGIDARYVGVSENAKRALGSIAHGSSQGFRGDPSQITAPATDAARQWQGWGTALKPALEPITVARKPLGSTVAECVLAHGTGAINVDGCRVGTETIKHSQDKKSFQKWKELDGRTPKEVENPEPTFHEGRWPANLIHDGSEEVLAGFPVTGASKAAARGGSNPNPMDWGNGRADGEIVKGHNDSGGSAARFFYCAKASKADRDAGLEGFEEQQAGVKNDSGRGFSEGDPYAKVMRKNVHPTVKPTDLMAYLVRLVTPPNGIVLDPFMGSGSTGKAAVREGFKFIGCEMSEEYIAIAKARIEFEQKVIQTDLFKTN